MSSDLTDALTEFGDVEAVHDHPCGDLSCSECWRPRISSTTTVSGPDSGSAAVS